MLDLENVPETKIVCGLRKPLVFFFIIIIALFLLLLSSRIRITTFQQTRM